jgi:pectinesterase
MNKFVAGIITLLAVLGPVRADDAAPAAGHQIKIVLVGDSTVTDNAGWGLGFKQFLTEGTECINTAQGGRSSESFMREGRWTNALALQADYYLIQFGHNNQPGKPGRSTDMPTFVANMKQYVDDARAIGAKPVLVTPMTRRMFRWWTCTREALNYASHWGRRNAGNSVRSKPPMPTARSLMTARI